MEPRELIARACLAPGEEPPEEWLAVGDAILAALAAEGYTVAKLVRAIACDPNDGYEALDCPDDIRGGISRDAVLYARAEDVRWWRYVGENDRDVEYVDEPESVWRVAAGEVAGE